MSTSLERPVAVIGIGNTLRGDDGAGPAVVALLEREGRLPAHVTVRSVHQLTPELAEDVSRTGCVVFVDASTTLPAGVVSTSCIAPAIGAVDLGAHALTPATLLAVCSSLFGHAPAAIVVAIGIAGVETGQTLSPEVQAAVSAAAEAVITSIPDSRFP
jgi:hydrogenase maturation protease